MSRLLADISHALAVIVIPLVGWAAIEVIAICRKVREESGDCG